MRVFRSIFLRGTYGHEKKQKSKAASRVDLREMQDILGQLLRNLRYMQVGRRTHERGR